MTDPGLPNPYGYFDPEGREYVITRPDTPTPWINYLGEGRYGGIISNTAGGYSFDRDPRNRRVTRYRYNAIPADQPGRYIYLRDMESGTFWSPTWQPVTACQLESYECRHGTAYTRISSTYQGIHASLLYFVPLQPEPAPAPCEVWVLHLKNQSDRVRRLRTFSYVELSYYDATIDMHNLDWGMHIFHTRHEAGVLYSSTNFRPTTTFFTSNQPALGFDSDREVFVGSYRSLSAPQVVASGEPGNSEAPRGNNIGSFCHELQLNPGEEKEIIYILGVTDEIEAIPPVLEQYRRSRAVRQSFAALRADWQAYLGQFQVTTPDPEMNAMLNLWNQVQCRITLFWSRTASSYESGLGRGMGTRDSAQDVLGTVHNVPKRARGTLSALWKLQFQDGHTWHQVFVFTGEGGPGHAEEFPDWPQWFSDDHLWIVLGVCAYLRETGDFGYLEERIPYWDGGEASVWWHMLRAVDFTLQHRGPHGLPRIGFSDWNDTLNIDHGSGKAESVFTAMQLCRVLLDLAELCDHLKKTAEADRFRELHTQMADAINQAAWDGKWFARAYDDAGLPLGVEGESENRLSLNPQTWAVIGEVADEVRARSALQSAHEKLNTPYGLTLMWPPYTHGDDRVRGTSTYPPGAKENGGIFCHANTWAIVAAARLGWNERAYQYYRQILPLARQDAERSLVEPYVYCQNICGPTHLQYGMGRNSWLTGTASWTYVAGTQWLLGIRPTYEGLRISPVIPPTWEGFSARRVFRGVTYHIQVSRAGVGNRVSLSVDGQPITGNVVPLPPEGAQKVRVSARMG